MNEGLALLAPAFFTTAHLQGKNIPGSFMDFLEEGVQMINTVKFWPLSTCFFNILCSEWGSNI